MKRPGPHIYLFGNPVSTFLLAIAAIYLGYEWWIGAASPVAAIVAVVAAAIASKANERLEAYNAWKREWQVMSGEAPTAGRLLIPYRALRIVLGVTVWSLFAYVALDPGPRRDVQIAAALFWLATALLIAGGIYRLVKRRSGARTKTTRDVPVTICLQVPHTSASVAYAYAQLPYYCHGLLPKPCQLSQ